LKCLEAPLPHELLSEDIDAASGFVLFEPGHYPRPKKWLVFSELMRSLLALSCHTPRRLYAKLYRVYYLRFLVAL